jgi:hypothetical protein
MPGANFYFRMEAKQIAPNHCEIRKKSNYPITFSNQINFYRISVYIENEKFCGTAKDRPREKKKKKT